MGYPGTRGRGCLVSQMLRAPFPWFGGKSRAADAVWAAFGDVPNYVEPFFGSGATLLGRPRGAGKIETVNDLDGNIANFWRSIQHDPEAVAEWCDYPVNEIELNARHGWLVEHVGRMTTKLRESCDYYDAKIAGWWVWGICQWIGAGWCSPEARPLSGKSNRPVMSHAGSGVHRSKLPTVGISGTGVNRLRLPALGNDRGINGVSATPCQEWFQALAVRLRRVRVACGDWTRVLGDSVLGKGKNVGGRRPCAVFMDPPYSHDVRCKDIYAEESADVSQRVREWCLQHGDDSDLRIALCGYEGEHDMPDEWECHAWRANGHNKKNGERERIWFSKHCLSVGAQSDLFAIGGAS